VHGDAGVTKIDLVMESIYSRDPRVDRHHPISSYYYITKYTGYLTQGSVLLTLSDIS